MSRRTMSDRGRTMDVSNRTVIGKPVKKKRGIILLQGHPSKIQRHYHLLLRLTPYHHLIYYGIITFEMLIIINDINFKSSDN